MTSSLSGAAAIVGIGETDYVRGSDKLPVELMLDAARDGDRRRRAHLDQIDGLIPPAGYTSAEELAANLGIEELRYSVTVHMGGASPVASLQSAAMAVARGAGRRTCCASSAGTATRRSVPSPAPAVLATGSRCTSATDAVQDFYLPYGAIAAAQFYSFLCMRHKQLYGIDDDDTGAVALAARQHAQLQRARAHAGTAAHDGRVPRRPLGH